MGVRRLIGWLLPLLAVVVLAGCSAGEEEAKIGKPCSAAELEPKNARFARECGQQKLAEHVKQEAGEAESVLRKRRAEEAANAVERVQAP